MAPSLRLVPLSSLDERGDNKQATTNPVLSPASFRHDGAAFVAFNGDRNFMQNIPSPKHSSMPKSAKTMMGEIHCTSWANLNMPHLLLLPRYHIFKGPLFECLDVNRRILPSQRVSIPVYSNKTWERVRLPEKTTDQWLKLEGFLLNVFRWVDSKHRQLCPGEYRGIIHNFPICFGYSKTYDSLEELTQAVANSRDAFLPLLAGISIRMLALDGFERSDAFDATKQPKWRETLFQAVNLEPQLWDALEDAVTECVSRANWFFTLILKFKLSVPLYFKLGTTSGLQFSNLPSIRAYRLEIYHGDLDQFRALPEPNPTVEWVFIDSTIRLFGVLPNPDYRPEAPQAPLLRCTIRADPPLPPPVPQAVPVDPGSGQRQGETIVDFLARRQRANERTEARESPEKKKSRLQREAHAAGGGPPGRNASARVFIWEDTNNDEVFIRRPINRDFAIDSWDTFSPNQRIYDSFSNQWDLCPQIPASEDPACFQDGYWDYLGGGNEDTEMAEAPSSSNAVEEAQSQSNDDGFPNLPQGLPTRIVALLSNGNAALDNIAEYYAADKSKPTSPDRITLQGGPVTKDFATSMLQIRFGYTDHDGSYANKTTEKTALNALGDDLAGSPKEGVRALLESIRTQKSLRTIQPELMDLLSEPDLLWQNRCVDVQYFFQVKAELYETHVFIIKMRSGDPRRIILFNASSVLHILRMQFSSFEEIAEEFGLLGTEFYAGIEGPTHQIQPAMPSAEFQNPTDHSEINSLHFLRALEAPPKAKGAQRTINGVFLVFAYYVISEGTNLLDRDGVQASLVKFHNRLGMPVPKDWSISRIHDGFSGPLSLALGSTILIILNDDRDLTGSHTSLTTDAATFDLQRIVQYRSSPNSLLWKLEDVVWKLVFASAAGEFHPALLFHKLKASQHFQHLKGLCQWLMDPIRIPTAMAMEWYSLEIMEDNDHPSNQSISMSNEELRAKRLREEDEGTAVRRRRVADDDAKPRKPKSKDTKPKKSKPDLKPRKLKSSQAKRGSNHPNSVTKLKPVEVAGFRFPNYPHQFQQNQPAALFAVYARSPLGNDAPTAAKAYEQRQVTGGLSDLGDLPEWNARRCAVQLQKCRMSALLRLWKIAQTKYKRVFKPLKWSRFTHMHPESLLSSQQRVAARKRVIMLFHRIETLERQIEEEEEVLEFAPAKRTLAILCKDSVAEA
ncbi:hypothetical protein MIND_00195600 [Mycena indigotica]|uniref:Uncharacterized protein n=1 Tax=Mycena indigotica TaxID=2126181 RepID=A0A8H6WAR2_9AGAR|nr:uncharacterized protein MIND_00195600 [Mycena indigotica]KAF7311849.1 hypothetical protein MIND_00195600 [Mycena indigotica]